MKPLTRPQWVFFQIASVVGITIAAGAAMTGDRERMRQQRWQRRLRLEDVQAAKGNQDGFGDRDGIGDGKGWV